MASALRVFVASSSEQIRVAKAVAEALETPDFEVKVWDEEIFNFSASYIESLEKELERADFAIVILTADDSGNVGRKKVNLPRDNVIFELGLFIGRLGRERCFFFVDRDSGTRIASDLSGVKPVAFDRGGGMGVPGSPNLASQTVKVAGQMRALSERFKPSPRVREDQAALWRFCRRIAGHWWERMRDGEDDKSALSYITMTVDEVTNTPHMSGWAYSKVGEPMADWESVITGVGLGKEPKIHYRWKGEHDKQHGQTFGGGGYIVFEDDELNSASGYFYDTNFAEIYAGAQTRVKHFGLYRSAPEEVEIMKNRGSDETHQLIRMKLVSLRGR
jgi:hypothetical protein